MHSYSSAAAFVGFRIDIYAGIENRLAAEASIRVKSPVIGSWWHTYTHTSARWNHSSRVKSVHTIGSTLSRITKWTDHQLVSISSMRSDRVTRSLRGCCHSTFRNDLFTTSCYPMDDLYFRWIKFLHKSSSNLVGILGNYLQLCSSHVWHNCRTEWTLTFRVTLKSCPQIWSRLLNRHYTLTFILQNSTHLSETVLFCWAEL